MNVPADLKYTTEHEWIRIEGNIGTVGITDWAQGELGDVVFVELPDEGASFSAGDAFGTIEAVKAVSELYSPLTGKVTAINPLLDDDPMTVNRDPYGDGWMIKIELEEPGQVEQLLDATGYKNLIADH